jgi:hypothetical protein
MTTAKTGSGRQLRALALTETVLPIPYDPAALPGATVLGADGQLYVSRKVNGVYQWGKQGVETLDGDLTVTRDLRATRVVLGGNPRRANYGGSVVEGSPPIDPAHQIEGTTESEAYLGIVRRNSVDALQPSFINLGRVRGNNPGGTGLVVTEDRVGEIRMSAGDGSVLQGIVAIRGRVGTRAMAGDVSGDLRLATRPPGDISGGIISRLLITEDGNVLIGNTSGTGRLSVTGKIQLTETADSYMVGANNVVGSRKTGWGAPTGSATRTAFDTPTVTLAQLAERLKALIDDLTTHGLIGA